MSRILFVCTGNVCRSPIAEGIMRAVLAESGLEGQWTVDSAGIHAVYGLAPTPLAIKSAAKYGADITELRSRPFLPTDFATFQHIIAMDHGHLDFLLAVKPAGYTGTLALLPGADGRGGIEIADPYGGSRADFTRAARLIAEGVGTLFSNLECHMGTARNGAQAPSAGRGKK